MEIPRLVYHGTFWPEGNKLGSEGLRVTSSYVSTTPDKRWAEYFAMHTRWKHKLQPGTLSIYEIDTGKLPQNVRENCIPPDGIDPRVLKWNDDQMRRSEENLKSDRIKIQDWRFPYIPLEAIVNAEEEHKDADPGLDLFTIGLLQPT